MVKCYHNTKELSRGNLKKVGVLHARPPAPAVTAVTTYRKPLPACLGRARALPLRGRGTRWRRYRVTKRGNCLRFFQKKIEFPGEVFFYFERVLLITCSVSYSNALTCFTDLGIVYHLARPALRTVLTSSCPPSGRCSIAIQER
jgi:hypothetical protein